MDQTGVPTDMLSLNSTIRISYRNPATFFGVHVSSTPVEFYYYQLKVASGQASRFKKSVLPIALCIGLPSVLG